MKIFMRSVLLLSFIAITTQDINGRKGCDCSICKGVDNKINPLVGKKIGDGHGGKSSCNICEQRKEMLRMEREKQRQLQKCPFEILGAPALKGKTSEEIFDEFREFVVPSQNGFFDMMRGIVKTMHVSSEAELKWAKEKEARELAKKKKEEEARKREELKSRKDEIVSLNSPVNPKVTVVLKQTPCGQVIAPSEPTEPEKIPLFKRLPKEANSVPEHEISNLQPIDGNDQIEGDYSDLNSKDYLLQSDVIEQLMGYNMMTSTPRNEFSENMGEQQENIYTFRDENFVESSTESPFVKFVSDEEMKALYSRRNSADDFGMGLNFYPTNMAEEVQEVITENAQSVDYSVEPVMSYNTADRAHNAP